MVKGATQNPTLKGILRITFKMSVLTGLLIRMPVQAQVYRIGGADQYPMVTRKEYDIHGQRIELEVPYVPGSSLKGRMRSLLELAYGLKLYSSDGKIWQHFRNLGSSEEEVKDFESDVLNGCPVDELFGHPAVNYKQILEGFKSLYKGREEEAERKTREIFARLTMTRVLFEDLFPSPEYVEALYSETGGMISIADFLEEKSENRIDRVTSAADPRQIVRVKPGVEFAGSITLLVFGNDEGKLKEYLETLVKGFKLIERTYLGGSGSRGYGRVRFKDIKISVLKAPELQERIVRKSIADTESFRRELDSIVTACKAEIFRP